MKTEKIAITTNFSTLRIDKFLSMTYPNYSRAYFTYLIKNKFVKINDEFIQPSYKLKENDVLEIQFNEKDLNENLKPYDFDLDVVYEDDDVLVINKPKGLVVHPGNGHENDTLVNALIFHNIRLSKINGTKRVGIVHRIDKDTSGLLLIAKNDFAHNKIAEDLKTHIMHREYIALVDGEISTNKGKIIGPIGRDKTNRLKMAIDEKNGKEAITHFEVIKRFKSYTLIKCILETGRTHQIRVHLSSINHPLVGDVLYGGSNKIYNDGQLLHAYKLSFIQPTTKKEVVLEIPLPQYFLDVLSKLEKSII